MGWNGTARPAWGSLCTEKGKEGKKRKNELVSKVCDTIFIRYDFAGVPLQWVQGSRGHRCGIGINEINDLQLAVVQPQTLLPL